MNRSSTLSTTINIDECNLPHRQAIPPRYAFHRSPAIPSLTIITAAILMERHGRYTRQMRLPVYDEMHQQPHSHNHCICNTHNSIWCCHSLTAAVNRSVLSITYCHSATPDLYHHHHTPAPLSPSKTATYMYLVHRRRSSTSPSHLLLLRVNDSMDEPWISSHHLIPYVALRAHPKILLAPSRDQHPRTTKPPLNIPCSMLLHPLYHTPSAPVDVLAMCTDANRMEAMVFSCNTARPCVHVLTLPHASVEKVGCCVRISPNCDCAFRLGSSS